MVFLKINYLLSLKVSDNAAEIITLPPNRQHLINIHKIELEYCWLGFNSCKQMGGIPYTAHGAQIISPPPPPCFLFMFFLVFMLILG